MLAILWAVMFAIAALANGATQTTSAPAYGAFVNGALTRSHIVNVDGFIGIEWQCSTEDDESCYAGSLNGSLTTGP